MTTTSDEDPRPREGSAPTPSKVSLERAFASFDAPWQPRIVGALNGQEVKLAKLLGEFVWHHHAEADELFLVLQGRLRMEFRERTVILDPGEMLIVPRGVEHRPVAEEEVQVLLFEPAGTINTGDAGGERTVQAQHIVDDELS